MNTEERIKSDTMDAEQTPVEASAETAKTSADVVETASSPPEPSEELQEEKPERPVTVAEQIKARARTVPPPRPPARRRGYVTRGAFAGWGFFLLLLSTLLGASLAVGVIFMYNSTLLYAPQNDVAELSGQVALLQGVDANLEYGFKALQGDVDALRARMRELEALPGEVDAIRRRVDELTAEVETTTTKTEEIEGELGKVRGEIRDLQERVETLAKHTEKFDVFLNALRDLLNDIQEPNE